MNYYRKGEPEVLFVLEFYFKKKKFFFFLRSFGLKGLWGECKAQNVGHYFPYAELLLGSLCIPCFTGRRNVDLQINAWDHITTGGWLVGRLSTKCDVDRPGFLVAPTSCVTLGVSEMYSEKFIRFC